MAMRPSITHLHLLRYTPFFTALSTEQLQWVIDHSREWEVDAGTLLSIQDACGPSDRDDWVLLDGSWQIEHDGTRYTNGHADPGKWFSTREMRGQPCALVATEHSYVMHIPEQEMQGMLAQGFAFEAHLAEGHRYYQALFSPETVAKA